MLSPSSSGEEYDGAETFAAALMDQVDKDSVNNMVSVQREMLSRFEKTNEMLINFNILSGNRYTVTSQHFRQHTQLMYDMKRDLDSIFKRIRIIKDKLRKSHPESFNESTVTIPEVDEEMETKPTDDVNNDSNTPTVVKPRYSAMNTNILGVENAGVDTAPVVGVNKDASPMMENLKKDAMPILNSANKDPESSGSSNDTDTKSPNTKSSTVSLSRPLPKYAQLPPRKMTIN
ncbi:KxDL motif-containing protein 1 [Mactra antiquata]